MHFKTVKGLLALLAAMLLIWPAAGAKSTYAQSEMCFQETGFCISGRFREYWLQNGGLAVFGFPIGPAQAERNRDTGQMYLTQRFERNRFELHPENQAPYDVLLGRLGDDRLLALGRNWQSEGREAGPAPGCLWFAQTGHNVCNQGGAAPGAPGFRRYWESHGLQDRALNGYQRSLALFGLPLTAPRTETNASGDTVVTQWFERARFEWHPGKPDEFKVLLGLLGSELRPGAAGRTAHAFPGGLQNVNGSLFFAAEDGQRGGELWRSDGTARGTLLVKDILPGPRGSNPSNLTPANSLLFFVASDGGAGAEVWRSDGTEGGTFMVKDILPGQASSAPHRLTNVNGTLFFIADDGQSGAELWKSDGTAAGTVRVKDIRPGPSGSAPTVIGNFGPPWQLTAGNGLIFFVANDGVRGDEVWRSDGTEAGTIMLTDVQERQLPYNLASSKGTLFFMRQRADASPQLWRSDGTPGGTAPVKEWGSTVLPGARSGGFTDVDGTLFFWIETLAEGVELWKSDGSAAGTVLVKDISPGPQGSNPTALANIRGTLFFLASDATGAGMWRSDGTAAGTIRVGRGDVPGVELGFGPTATELNGQAVWITGSAEAGYQLWRSDGTPGGTQAVTTLTASTSSPSSLVAADGLIFFSYDDNQHGIELWRTDLTPEGTTIVRDINTNR